MCTVIVAVGVHPSYPLIVAANRDEFYERPSAPPATLPGGLFGPRDLRAGGTWMAVNRAGVFATLTNAAPPDLEPIPGIASRGAVVGRVLDAPDARYSATLAGAIPLGETRPFYLLVADSRGTYSVAPRRDSYEVEPLSPGVHVQENRPLDHPTSEKVVRARHLVQDLATWPADALVPRLHAVLSDHEPGQPSLRQLCVHTDGYGTRSSSVLLFHDSTVEWHYLEGHPCKGEFARIQKGHPLMNVPFFFPTSGAFGGRGRGRGGR